MLLKPNDHVLFYGDSITDCGRRNERPYSNYGMGQGYAALVWGRLAAAYPEMNLRCTNRGVSGDRIPDLLRRFDADVLAEKPHVVSILIGVNDTWRAFDSNDPSPIPRFQADYRKLLRQIVDTLAARLVILEPFLMDLGERCRQMRADLNPRIDSIRELAREFGATYVPLDGLFAAACCRAPAPVWTDDGVHPLPPGHSLIAEAWIKAVLG